MAKEDLEAACDAVRQGKMFINDHMKKIASSADIGVVAFMLGFMMGILDRIEDALQPDDEEG